MQRLLVGLVRLYQAGISPLLPGACRFKPTCSNYGIEAIRRHGPIKGCWLTATRILRCSPGGPAGDDPVP